MIPNLVPNQKTKKNTVRLIMQTNLLKWEVDMFIHITLKQILWSSVTTTTWKPCSRLLVQNKFLPITNLFLAADVDSFSCLPILVQLPQFLVLEDGPSRILACLLPRLYWDPSLYIHAWTQVHCLLQCLHSLWDTTVVRSMGWCCWRTSDPSFEPFKATNGVCSYQ